MNYVVFAENPSIGAYLKEILEAEDTLVLHPLFRLLEIDFQKDDFVLVSTYSLSTVYRLRSAMRQPVPMTAIVQHQDGLQNPSLYPPVRIIGEPLRFTCLRTLIEEEKSHRKLMKSIERHIAGQSESMYQLRSSIILASINNCPVHISGETGTGKTLAARLIHKISRQSKEMVYINCANLKSSLSDSDLFGHIKGSFTNASQSRQGLLGRANESSLFLDEIGDLPEEVQGKLLDTIENGSFRNIGSDEEKNSSFRLITAGQQSLETLLEQKKLRKDFYYRISNMHVEIKPLRDHKEDIPDIVDHYEKNRHIKDCRIHDYQELMNREWYGNIRELIHYLDIIHLNHNTRKNEDEKE